MLRVLLQINGFCQIVMARSTAASARNLYKQIIFTGRSYPGGLDYVRRKAKEEFAKYKDEKDPEKIKLALARGKEKNS